MSENERIPVSAFILTCNNEDTIERALDSLRWADELIVVDSGSTDATLDLARRHGARIVPHAWPGNLGQYQFAMAQCAHDWVVYLDSDEEMSPALIEEIQTELRANAARPEAERIRGYILDRRTFFLGRWHTHGGWGRDRCLRLFDSRRGEWEGVIHAGFKLKGRSVRLQHAFYHYSYSSITEQVKVMDKYSGVIAEDLLAQGQRPSLWKMIAHPLAGFLRDYVLRGGFREGVAGFVVAINCMAYVFWKYAKLWEAEKRFPQFDESGPRP